MAYIHHELGKTHYTKKGRRGKVPIIWLHGGPGGQHQRDSPVFSLAQDRIVYCYTQLGGGKSSKTTSKHWNIQTFVKELELLIEAWELTEFHLMGGSWGTTLALEYYLKTDGQGVKSLVFQSPLFSSKDWKRDGRRLLTGLPKKTQHVINTCHEIGATDSKVYAEAIKKYYLQHVLRRKKPPARLPNPNGELVYDYMWGPSELEPAGTLKNYSRHAHLRKIKVPTLIICGEHDEATPETGVGYANKIPGCSFAEIKGASHVIWVEKPTKIKRVINDFLHDLSE